MSTPPEKEYTGGCHCQKFQYKFTQPAFENGEREIDRCTCSICVQKGAVWAMTPEAQFALTKGTLAELTLYEFHKRVFKHYFCPVCGVQIILTVPRDGMVYVNVRTTDGVDVERVRCKVFDGKNLL
ncbi:GFA domain-containing protein [Phanerochaete sordida]|uniref:GFA domain-containing protein n=1 Tax=Phanerochaete sordida TaxID=48140 RepID=A0A9P3GBB2_9APHY|nr:GFA domain-containing protein [Phanerochaete sordida]